jgi:acetyl esterase/lipase
MQQKASRTLRYFPGIVKLASACKPGSRLEAILVHSRFSLILVITSTVLLGSGTAQAGKNGDVKSYCDITYCDIPDDPNKDEHQLDVYRPKGQSNCPVLVFWHGGAWCSGCKDKVMSVFGYGNIAESFAQRGVVVVLPNYRLSPAVKHPEHIKDAARAFAWTCAHISEYGGDPSRIFVGGHSAGGHLACLMAVDPTWLKAEGRSQKDIQGVVSVSGVYKLEDIDYDVKWDWTAPKNCFKCKGEVRPLILAFGSDADVIKDASPITHVHSGLPPFLLLSGGLDYSPLKRMSKEFFSALKDADCEAELKTIAWRTHDTLLFDFVHQTADKKMANAVMAFIKDH